jgi:hypothetical protein
MSAAEADGEVAWSDASVLASRFRKASFFKLFSGATVARKPITGESAK